MKDFFTYRESLTEAKGELEWKPYTKYKGSPCYLVDPKNGEHLNSVGVKNKNQLKGKKTIDDFGWEDDGYFLDYDIYIAQTSKGSVIHTPESDIPYVFIEKFKVNKGNVQKLMDWYLNDTSWIKAV